MCLLNSKQNIIKEYPYKFDLTRIPIDNFERKFHIHNYCISKSNDNYTITHVKIFSRGLLWGIFQ